MDSPSPKNALGEGARDLPRFRRFADWAAAWTGRPEAFILAAAIVFLWALSGPFFGYDEAWQLAISTGTSVLTFLMVFLIQHSQSRGMLALQVKLDELIRATHHADNALAAVEDAAEETLHGLRRAVREKIAAATPQAENEGRRNIGLDST